MIAERGHDQPLPAGFEGPEALGCQPGSHTPKLQQFIFTGEGSPLTTGEEALRVVRRLNLDVQLMGDRPYQALAITYAPATGEFDMEAADWYVWLSRL
jgi:hypothetical protein